MSFKLLDDEPSNDDSFGAHKRIASAIRKAVEVNDGGKVIALIGEWGSGKSTTITLLKDIIDRGNIGIFTYDTWVHSGDHLRKSFLNELVDFLLKNKFLLDGKKWALKKDELSGKLKRTEKSIDHQLSKHGKILLPFIFGWPIATTIFSGLIAGYIQDQYFFFHYHFLIFCLFVVSIFAMVFPIGYLLWLLIRGKAVEILSLFLNKSTQSEKITSLESPEATTLEFQEIFRSIMVEGFQSNNKKLIIVLDNLDRLEDSEAQTIWALLRGFIDNPNYKKSAHETWLKNLWVIVPLAERKNVIKSPENLSSHNSEMPEVRTTSLFLEKVFQVRFYLPPVVHSDWKKNLSDLLKSSFQGVESIDLDTILRLYEAYVFDSPDKSPTPREIKLFINDLVAMSLIWGDQHKFSLYAAYILTCKTHGTDFLTQLRVGRAVSTSFKSILRRDPARQFAAFFFNIDDLKKANAMLLKQTVEQALMDRSGGLALEEFQDNPGLIDILEATVSSSLPKWVEDSPQSFFTGVLNVTRLISKNLRADNSIDLDSNLSGLEEVRTLLFKIVTYALAAQFKYFPFNVSTATKAIIELSKIDTSDRIILSVLDSIKKIAGSKIDDSSNVSLDRDDSENGTMIASLRELYLEERFKVAINKLKNNELKFPITFSVWIKLCSEFSEESDFLRVIHPLMFTGENSTEEKLKKLIDSSSYDGRFLKVLKREIRYSENSALVDVILNKMKFNLDRSPSELLSFHIVRDLIAMKLAGQDKANQLLESLVHKKLLFHMLYKALSNGKRDQAAPLLLAVFLKVHDLYKTLQGAPNENYLLTFFNSISQVEVKNSLLNEIKEFVTRNNLDAVYEDPDLQIGEFGKILLKHVNNDKASSLSSSPSF